MNPNDDLGEQAAELAAAVQELGEKVGMSVAIERRTATVETLTKKNRRWVQITVVGLLLDLSLTILGVGLFRQVDNSQTRLDRVSGQLTDAQCTLDGLIVASYEPNDPEARNGVTVEAYNSRIKPFFDSYRDLGCLPKLADGVGP